MSSVGQSIARAYAVRPRQGTFVAPRLVELEFPAGYRPVVDQAEARALWDLSPAVAGVLREDSRQTRHAVWQAVCDLWSDTGVVTATQEAIAERASVRAGYRVARQTAGNHVRALLVTGVLFQSQTMHGASAAALGTDTGRAGSYVVLVEDPGASGTTPGSSRDDVENAQVSPVVEELGHLPERSNGSLSGVGTTPRIGGDFFPPSSDTSQNQHREVTGDAAAQRVLGRSGDALGLTQRQMHPELYAPQTGPERQQAVLSLIAVMGWAGQQRAEQELSTITRPFFGAGWSTRAIIHAFEHRPDGGAWPCSLPAPHQRDSPNAPAPRSLWAVLTWRLGQWRRDDGTPVAPPVEVFRPRRGRPSGAVSRRRKLADTIERLPVTDPRRQAAYAELSGEPAPVIQPRGAEAEAAVSIERAKLDARAAQRAAEQADRQARTARLRAELDAVPVDDRPVVDEPPAAVDDGPDPARLLLARAILRARTERAGRVVVRVPR